MLVVAASVMSCHGLPPLFESLPGSPEGELSPSAGTDEAAQRGVFVEREVHETQAHDHATERSVPSWRSWVTPWPAFALDEWSRQAERTAKGRLVCPAVELVGYRGQALRYHRALKVNPAFQAQLARFEAVANEVAIEVYGRAPSKVVHLGTYNCRTIRRRGHRLSEHAFGNAIDVSGFEFAAAPRAERKALGRAGRAFRVDVEKHWDRTDGFEASHARFLKRLVIELQQDRVFRGMIVPPAPGHHDHLHLDMGRWAFVRGDVTLPPPVMAVGVEGPRS